MENLIGFPLSIAKEKLGHNNFIIITNTKNVDENNLYVTNIKLLNDIYYLTVSHFVIEVN